MLYSIQKLKHHARCVGGRSAISRKGEKRNVDKGGLAKLCKLGNNWEQGFLWGIFGRGKRGRVHSDTRSTRIHSIRFVIKVSLPSMIIDCNWLHLFWKPGTQPSSTPRMRGATKSARALA